MYSIFRLRVLVASTCSELNKLDHALEYGENVAGLIHGFEALGSRETGGYAASAAPAILKRKNACQPSEEPGGVHIRWHWASRPPRARGSRVLRSEIARVTKRVTEPGENRLSFTIIGHHRARGTF
jgi:hypothetical protein